MNIDKIASIEIRNTFGIEYIKFPVRSIVRLRAANGGGKSSVLNAISRVFQGGKDASVIRAGCSESFVEFTTAEAYTIRKRIWLKRDGSTGSELLILDPGNNEVPEPATYLKRLADAEAVDPGALLRIDASKVGGRRELAQLLQRIVPMDFDTASITKAITVEVVKAKEGKVSHLTGEKWIDPKGRKIEDAVPLPLGKLGLKQVRALIKEVVARRQRVGSTKEEAQASIGRLRSSLPTTEIQDYREALRQAEIRQQDLTTRETSGKISANQVADAMIRTAERDFHILEQDIDFAINEAFKKLEDIRLNGGSTSVCLDVGKKHIQANLEASRVAAETKRMELSLAVDAELRTDREAIAGEIATIKAQVDGQQRAEWTRQEIEVQTRTLWEAEYLWAQLTGAKERLEQLLADKLDKLPVPGLEVSEDAVLVDGIPWHVVNTARKIQIAVSICALIAGEIGFMILDDCEHLDNATLAELEQAVTEAGYQLIEAVVDSSCDTLKIEQVA